MAIDLAPELLDILACPNCHGSLAVDHDRDELVCLAADCGLAYPVRQGIPVLLIDEARRPGSDLSASSAASAASAPSAASVASGALSASAGSVGSTASSSTASARSTGSAPGSAASGPVTGEPAADGDERP